MNLRKVLPLALPLAAMIFAAPAIRAQQAQQPDHAVTSQDLRQDLQSASQTRQADEAAVRELFSSDAAQKELKSAHVDYKKVDSAISQLSDEDLSRMASRSREIQKDFAGGNMTDRDLLLIVVVAVVIVLIVVAVR